MAFNLERGLAFAGEAMSKTLGQMTIEEQRAELEKKKIELADQLAGMREEKDRAFRGSEAEKQRGFLSGENALNRSTELDRTKISAGASIASASISANASKYATDARINESKAAREQQAEENKLNRLALAPGREVEVEKARAQIESIKAQNALGVINADTAKEVKESREALLEAQKSGDQKAMKEAQQRNLIATYNAGDENKHATVAATLAEGVRRELDAARTSLMQLEKSINASMPETQAVIQQHRARVKELERRWNQQAAEAARLQRLVPKLEGIEQVPPRDLNQYIRSPGQMSTPTVPGLLNQGQ